MRPGSVIVDLAAEAGGNCELTQPGETVVKDGVTILGPANLPATLPIHASQMYSRNIYTFLDHLIEDGALRSTSRTKSPARRASRHEGQVLKAPVAV